MRYLDRRTCLLLIGNVLCLLVLIYPLLTVSSSVVRSADQKNRFLADKKTALATLEELEFLEKNYPAFQAFIDNQKFEYGPVSDGLGGMESQRKLSWIKHLQSSKTRLGIRQMSFELYPYQPIADNLESLEISIGVESIVLRVSLLHDGVLAELLEKLTHNAPNPFVVTAIEIDRVGLNRKGVAANGEDNITAEITMTWYLIDAEGADNDVAS